MGDLVNTVPAGQASPRTCKSDRSPRTLGYFAGRCLLFHALQNSFWARPLPGWRLVLCVCFLLSAIVLSWTGAHSLGRQWRVDAGLNQDHELIVSGPYRVVRHPIYTSMLCLLCGTGFMITPLWLLLSAVVVFVVGTEIRIRTEDQLLSARFAEQFREYEHSVPAYIPFLR